MKTVLILVDGMRPDGLFDIPYAKKFAEGSAYTMQAKTVFPSVTLPCHMSLFHSVDPARHGVTTNTFTPQVRPVKGLCEVLNDNGKSCAFFYNWEELRDLSRPGSLIKSYYVSERKLGFEEANRLVTDAAITSLTEDDPDFIFLYLGWPDYAGHWHGWMGEEYFHSVRRSWDEIERFMNELAKKDEEYTVFVTADHGGHDRGHGADIPEDMIIPLYVMGKDFTCGKEIEGANIMDIAPTITKLFGLTPPAEWEGKAFI